MSLVLKAKVSTVTKFEEESGKSLVETLKNIQDTSSIAPLFRIVQAFSGADDDAVDAFFVEKGFDGVTQALLEALQDSGFLPKETKETEKPAKPSQK